MTRRAASRDRVTTPPKGTPRVAALRLLGRRDYTASELIRRLVARGYPPDDVESDVADLKTQGIIDDRRAAEAHVRTASRVKGRGVGRITRELQARGVDAALIRDATSQLSPDDERQAIQQFLKRRRIQPPVPLDQRRRVAQQLLRRGFTASLIRAALNFELDDVDES